MAGKICGTTHDILIKGDGFCDDEANIELCDYDELDCCSLELVVTDRTRTFGFFRTELELELKSSNPNRTRTELFSNKKIRLYPKSRFSMNSCAIIRG